mmetsp:Transcript_47314/g.119766  ORF Transcript_47314/g.119766 Transcript_47314/m.119766 type:complete len:319 (+) Transcript_47314:517-1473(+)
MEATAAFFPLPGGRPGLRFTGGFPGAHSPSPMLGVLLGGRAPLPLPGGRPGGRFSGRSSPVSLTPRLLARLFFPEPGGRPGLRFSGAVDSSSSDSRIGPLPLPGCRPGLRFTAPSAGAPGASAELLLPLLLPGGQPILRLTPSPGGGLRRVMSLPLPGGRPGLRLLGCPDAGTAGGRPAGPSRLLYGRGAMRGGAPPFILGRFLSFGPPGQCCFSSLAALAARILPCSASAKTSSSLSVSPPLLMLGLLLPRLLGCLRLGGTGRGGSLAAPSGLLDGLPAPGPSFFMRIFVPDSTEMPPVFCEGVPSRGLPAPMLGVP